MSTAAHVVIGSGAIGSGVVHTLIDTGERVRVVTRSGSGPEHPLVERVAMDAADADGISRLAEGARAIYNCANPPYHRWATDWPPIGDALLTAAERSGAVLTTMSNLYGYGPVDGPMTEDTPLAATFTKGRVRADMWRTALAAHQAGRARVTEVRGSDYIGPRAQTQFAERVVPKLLAGKAAQVLGDPDAAHTWTYTLDAARLLVTVATDERAWGRPWHVPSHIACGSRQVVADMCRLAGVPEVPVKPIPHWLIKVGGLFSPLLRELPEVQYQHDRPFVMDSSAAQRTFGLSPTPWDEILLDTMSPFRAAAGRTAA
jgi:nucleoside-diphosphate-sugar epimerase